jgi:hypothetical protein
MYVRGYLQGRENGRLVTIANDSLYEETKWEKLKDRRNNHKLVLFHKMNYNKTPQYLAELFPKTVCTRHSRIRLKR